jgi:hypothetical protein
VWFDGYEDVVGGAGASMFPSYDPIIAGHLTDPSPLSMDSMYRMATATAGTLFVHIEVTDDVTTGSNLVHFVIVEDDLEDQINLAREVLADDVFALSEPGESVDIVRLFDLDPTWNIDKIGYIVFVQSHAAGKEVLQASTARRGEGIKVTPPDDLVSEGGAGAPFVPTEKTYRIENMGPATLDYAVTPDEPWLSVIDGAGSLAPQESAEITVHLNEQADDLDPGLYTAQLSFENPTNHIGDTSRGVRLEVGEPELVQSFPLDENPGWTISGGLWAYGTPAGGGGQFGCPDPVTGHTGPNVYGYNLDGDYENGMSERHLTSEPIDCTGFAATTVRFWRWLGVELPAYDHAYVRASNDGTSWTTVWANEAEIADSTWTQVECDISGVADGQPTVYLRWTMGTTDVAWQYCGWNIDDIEIRGILSPDTGVAEGGLPLETALLANFPNPFNPKTTIVYEVPGRTRVDLRAYDLTGRLVRVLEDSEVEPGRHAAEWDGKDGAGRRVASGVYFCRLEAGSVTVSRRMVLLK